MIRFKILKNHGTLVIGGRLFHVEGTPVRETVVDAYGNYRYDFRNEVRLPQGPYEVADSAETRIELDRLAEDGVIEILSEDAA
jgi:hypothetical protein